MPRKIAMFFVGLLVISVELAALAQKSEPAESAPPAASSACPSFREASQAYAAGNLDTALKGYQACLGANPEDARLNFLVGLIYENKGNFDKAIKYWSQAVILDPFYQEFLRYRFDKDVPGVTRGLIHDHFGQKFCFGFLFIGPEKISFRSLWGRPRLGTDDSFETPIENIARVDVKAKARGKGWISHMPERFELHFRFKSKIRGSQDNWSRNEMKFFFGQTRILQTDLMAFAQNVLTYLRDKNVPVFEK